MKEITLAGEDGHTLDRSTAIPLRERRRQETAAEITEAALTLFERHGVDGTTVEDIARAAGVSPRTCFRYFPSKEAMVLRLHSHFDEAIDNWLENMHRDGNVLSQLEDVFSTIVDRIGDADSQIGRQFRRVRLLVHNEPALRFASRALDIEHAEQIAHRIGERFTTRDELLDARLATESARVVLWASFDQWARAIEMGEEIPLSVVYAHARTRLRGVICES